MVIIMINQKNYKINNKEIIVERVFNNKGQDLVDMLIKYYLNLKKKEDC